MKTEFTEEKKQNINKKWQQFKNTDNRFFMNNSSSDSDEKLKKNSKLIKNEDLEVFELNKNIKIKSNSIDKKNTDKAGQKSNNLFDTKE